jgi:hypothetical protein
MKNDQKKDETSISLDPKSLSFMNNAERVRALGGHCPPRPPSADQADIPDEEL